MVLFKKERAWMSLVQGRVLLDEKVVAWGHLTPTYTSDTTRIHDSINCFVVAIRRVARVGSRILKRALPLIGLVQLPPCPDSHFSLKHREILTVQILQARAIKNFSASH